jgi:uncharacterized protein YjhX (UPF0386 family)
MFIVEFNHNSVDYLLFNELSCKSISYSSKKGRFYRIENEGFIVQKTTTSCTGLEKNLVFIGWVKNLSERWFKKAGFVKEDVYDTVFAEISRWKSINGKPYNWNYDNINKNLIIMKRKL